jgi:hypothetical protein
MSISTPQPMQFLLTLPPRMAREFETLAGKRRPAWFATSDPTGSKLGSGGGTRICLRKRGRRHAGENFPAWRKSSRKLILRGGGLNTDSARMDAEQSFKDLP